MSLLFVVAGVLWYVFVYQPLTLEASQLRLKLNAADNKLNNAQKAKQDLSGVEIRLKESQAELQNVKQKILDRDELGMVANELRSSARKFNIRINDFTPVLSAYFASTGNAKVKPLPIEITVTGRYLNIGRFIDNLKKMQFFLIPENIQMKKAGRYSNDIETKISCSLYTWNR